MDGAFNNLNMSSKAGLITNNEELRIVMVGKTGVGKSASGNMILGREAFTSKFSAKSMTTECKKETGLVSGQKVAVIDTPALFDTRYDKQKTIKDLNQCISCASPGPHVFLVVIKLGRFTDEEKRTVEIIQQVFGEAADQYSMVLFTGGNELTEPIEDFLDDSPDLQELVARCNNQYHVFNNKIDDRSQVDELLQKIRNIVEKNGGSHYTNEMFQEAERAIREETERKMKEKEEEIRRKEEEIKKKLSVEFEKKMMTMKKKEEEMQRAFQAVREQLEREARVKVERECCCKEQGSSCVIQ